MKIYTEDDVHTNLLKGQKVAILGYGNQGRAHALNLRDSGMEVIVGTRRGGTGWHEAIRAGFESVSVSEATARADVVVMMLPDEVQGAVLVDEILGTLRPGATIVFPHGFAVAFGVVEPPADHDTVLVAPKAQGETVRAQFLDGAGVTCLVGIAHDATGRAMQKALSYASLVGCLACGAIETTFREEAVTDLFGEQVVLCGGVPDLVRAAFDELVSRGYAPEIAYLECLHELKIITDLMVDKGIAGMRSRISRTAAWGSLVSGERVVSRSVRRAISGVLDDIESGQFARGWIESSQHGASELESGMAAERNHPIERAGRHVRALLPDSEPRAS